jgi:hypothetical protein
MKNVEILVGIVRLSKEGSPLLGGQEEKFDDDMMTGTEGLCVYSVLDRLGVSR